MTWDRKELDREFLFKAESAEKYCQQIRPTMAENKTYQRLYDEHMAEFSVYWILHDNLCLKSRQALLQELRRMLDVDILPDQYNDVAHIRGMRRSVIKALISRFEEEAE